MRQCYNDWNEIHWIPDGKCSQTWCPNHVCPTQIEKSFDQNCAPHYELNIKHEWGEIDCAGSETETATNPTGKTITNAIWRSIMEVIKIQGMFTISFMHFIYALCCECRRVAKNLAVFDTLIWLAVVEHFHILFGILSYCAWLGHSVTIVCHPVQMANGKWTWLAAIEGGSVRAQS